MLKHCLNRLYFHLGCAALLMGIALAVPALAENTMVINEVMSSTAIYVDGQSYDWVELYNPTGAQINLSGWYLSNDPYNLQKWAFPSGTKVAKGGYLLVYCAGKEVTDGKKNTLYAPFDFSPKGDGVYLTDAEGSTVSVQFGAQFGNVSWGLPQGGSKYRYLESPTPGAENSPLGFTKRAAEPVIQTAAGFYTDTVEVVITAQEGQQIRYTLDSSTPTRESPLYEEPLILTKTTVVRAACFGENLLGSTVAGSTFFINDPSPVPVVSVYTDYDYFYSNRKGILVKGSGRIPNYSQNWEYPVQFEYFDKNGQRGIVQMGTTRVGGHSSRSIRQKTLSIFARKAFGSDTFDYAFFEDRDYTSYATIVLRSTSSDYKSCRLRDAVFMQMSEGLGLYYQAGRPIVVYINGEYFGHYNLREKANKKSLAQWEGITDEDVIDGIDILEGTGMAATQVLKGSNADWVELMNFCKNNSLKSDPEKLQFVLDRIDVDSLFNYCIFNMMIGNYDAGNVRVYRFPGGKWKFMLHDIEAGCMNGNESPVDVMLRSRTSKASQFPHWPLAALLEVAEYRDLFLQRVAEIVHSNFLYTSWVEPIYQKWIDQLNLILPRHIQKFRHFTLKEWNTNVHASMYYARIRPKKVINFICSRMNVSNADKTKYFQTVLDELAVYNAREQ